MAGVTPTAKPDGKPAAAAKVDVKLPFANMAKPRDKIESQAWSTSNTTWEMLGQLGYERHGHVDGTQS